MHSKQDYNWKSELTNAKEATKSPTKFFFWSFINLLNQINKRSKEEIKL